MAGYDPNQPRDEDGKWVKAVAAARAAAGISPTPVIEQHIAFLHEAGVKTNITHAEGQACKIHPSRPLRGKHPKDQKKLCYQNAFSLALNNPEYTYVEGLAVPGFIDLPFEHAWVVDAEGFVIDTTWDDGKEYFGVPMEFDAVQKIVLDKGTYGVIQWDSPLYEDFVKTGKLPPGIKKKIP